jgi:hypothetical protein
MPTNISKSHQTRFWISWRKSGATSNHQHPQDLFSREFVSIPLPIAEVTMEIENIIYLLNELQYDVLKRLRSIKQRNGFTEETERLEKLLEEVRNALHWTDLSEYHLAKEYLGWVLPKGDEYLKPLFQRVDTTKRRNALLLTSNGVVKRRILEIFDKLNWCLKNDRRSSFHWEPIPQKKAV